MKKKKKFFRSPVFTVALFVLAAVLLAFSGIGGARAALTYFSETYTSRVQMYDIGVSLLENGKRVSWRDYDSAANGTWDEATGALLADMLGEGEELQLGRAYDEVLSVTNSGTINQYVRVTIYKYWTRKNEDTQEEEKMQNLSPDLIDLHLVNIGTDWILDESSSTAERTVLYYSRLLPAQDTLNNAALKSRLPSGANGSITTQPFTDTLTVDGMLATKVTQTVEILDASKNSKKITTTYDYDGVTFNIEATVDAVQEHNAQAAILSAWGRNVSIKNGQLTL